MSLNVGARRGRFAATFVVCCMPLLALSARAQTLTNGSFESGAFVDNINHVMTLPVSATDITGWTIISGETAWGRNDNPFVGASATNGNLFLDLTGFHDAVPYGGVTQTITTTPGAPYALTFDLMTNENDSRYRGPVAVTATAGATSLPFTFTPPVGSTGVQSAHFVMPFLATGTTTPITIQGTLATGGQYLGLDNVAVVPEPAVAGLVATGLLLCSRRHRQPRRARSC
jgi:hypothetical protein